MTQVDPQTEQHFEAWLRTQHGGAHARRTAERNAAFLLPHLKPGMRLLDIGCGPGSITLGLARTVAPGEAVGIDRSAESIAAARVLAEAQGCTNIRFETGDCYALPFEDASFDAVFIHAVLQHLEEPLAALKEARRVIRSGGVVAIADADFDGSLLAPEDPVLTASLVLAGRMRRGAYIGKHLRELLHLAGFVRAVASATAMTQGDAVSVRMTGEFWANYHAAPEFIERITSKGWATADEIAAMSAAWRAWGQRPGAMWTTLACEAIGWAE